MDHRPLDRLLEVMEAARCGGPIPAQAAEWLVDGCDQYLEGQADSIDRALGLGRLHGQPTAATQYRKDRRNHHLRCAFALCGGLPPWARAGKLLKEIEHFEENFWPSWRWLDELPPNTSELRTHLWHARRLDRLPKSQGALYRLTKSTVTDKRGPDFLSAEAMKG